MQNDYSLSTKRLTMKQLLLIEDDVRQAAMLKEFFSFSGIALNACHTGATGLKELRAGTFDALLLDVMLPDRDGFDICREVRTFSNIPIIMLTAKGEETDRIVGLEIGADDYLPKPFNPRELLARVNAILRRGRNDPTQSSPALTFGKLEISDEERVARLNDTPLDLTAYQFDILHTLAKHAGRVMSRDALMAALGGNELDAFDRSIDVHISRIRAQIEDNPKKPKRILTIRGIGYVFSKLQA